MDWQLKGRGAANVVYGYCGEDRDLVGHVLRVRMPSAHAATAVDQLIWAGALDGSQDGDEVRRELQYSSQVVGPLLGSQFVFPGVPYAVPVTLAESLIGTGGSCGGGLLATIQPDHTTFLANAPPDGYVGLGPAVCLEIKPKWGLQPGASTSAAGAAATAGGNEQPLSTTPHQPPGRVLAKGITDADVEADADADAGAAAAGTGHGAIGGSNPGGGAVPAASEAPRAQGAGADASTQGADADACYSLRYPRFMLHMVYKHVKEGAPLSLYNPLDLFSGRLDRMQRALRCLLEAPSNNLRIFRDGVQVYGAAVKAAAAAAAGADGGDDGSGGGDHRPHVGVSDAAAHGSADLDRLATDLRGFIVPDENADMELNAGAAAAVAYTTTAAEVKAAAAGSEAAAAALGNTLEAVIRLTALVLQREGVMARLHSVQAMDRLGARGALRLYRQLSAALQAGQLPLPQPADGQEGSRCCGGVGDPATASTSAAGRDDGTASATAAAAAAGACATPAGAEAGAVAGLAVEELEGALRALRHYLMSVTAKDCAIMVTLQRAERAHGGSGAAAAAAETSAPAAVPDATPAAPPDAAGAGLAAATATAAAGRKRPLPDVYRDTDAGAAVAHVTPPPPLQSQTPLTAAARPWVGLLTDPAAGPGGRAFLYKLAFVDLDVKAAAKIPRHAELERELEECARANATLLARYAKNTGWEADGGRA